MSYSLKGKKGAWVKPGGGGSYRGYMYMRAAPKSYPTTSQQGKVGDAGRKVGENCTGKKGAEFKKCRHEALAGL
jgi:hypothetical protein